MTEIITDAETNVEIIVEPASPVEFIVEGALVGAKGDVGSVGPTGPTGPTGPKGDIALFVGPGEPISDDVLWVDTDETANLTIPAGGTTGQILSKTSNTDYQFGWVTITPTTIGLGNVNNTSDANKPVSTAMATALALKANISSLAAVATSGDHGQLVGLADDDHPQYHNDARGDFRYDSRYANPPLGVMSKSVFATLLSSYGLFGHFYDNSGGRNDLIVYGLTTQAVGTPAPGTPLALTSTTGNVPIRSDTRNRVVVERATSTVSGITLTNNGDGTYTLNGTATADVIFYPDSIANTNNIYVPAGKITLSGVTGGSSSTYLTQLALLLADNTQQFRSCTNGPATFTQAQAGMGRIYINVKSGTVMSNVLISPQLEYAENATAFEKNTNSTQTIPFGSTQLRSVPNGVADRVYRKSGIWYFEQNVGSQGSIAGTDVTIAAMKSNGSFFSTTGGTIAGTTITFASTVTGATVVYELATPVTTVITDPAIIAALENVRTYRSVTNLTSTTPISGSYSLDMIPIVAAISPETLISRTTGIDAKTTGNNTLYTVPTGKTLVVTRVILRPSAVTSITTGPTASVGGTTTADVFASVALATLNATTKMYTYTQSGMSTLVPAGTTLKLNISVAASGTLETLTADVMGYLI